MCIGRKIQMLNNPQMFTSILTIIIIVICMLLAILVIVYFMSKKKKEKPKTDNVVNEAETDKKQK